MFKFQTLIVWQKGFSFVQSVHDLSSRLPKEYRFSLKDQLFRAALSIINNIAEASGRETSKDKRYYFIVANGSLHEVINMILLIRKFGIIKKTEERKLLYQAREMCKMLHVIIKNLQN